MQCNAMQCNDNQDNQMQKKDNQMHNQENQMQALLAGDLVSQSSWLRYWLVSCAFKLNKINHCHYTVECDDEDDY